MSARTLALKTQPRHWKSDVLELSRSGQVRANGSLSFGELLREHLHGRGCALPVVHLDKNEVLYVSGERGDSLFLIETGWVTRKMYSQCGKASLLGIQGRGDVVGEDCLFRFGRAESVAAKVASTLLAIRRDQFLEVLRSGDLLAKWLECMGSRIAEQQEMISQFVTMDSEQRLAVRLLLLGRRYGQADMAIAHVRQKITHEEFGEMVGTTRSRVGLFLKRFEEAGMIQRTRQGFMVHMERVQAYVESRVAD